MRSIECTVVETDAAAALKAAAAQLGIPAEDLHVEALEEGLFRAEALRAPAEYEVAVAPDGMRAELARFAPAVGDAPQPTKAELLAALTAAGVVHGVLHEELDALLARAPAGAVEERVLVAHGTPPRPGRDALVRPLWPRPTEEDPARRVRIVRDGEPLLEHEPADPGDPGRDVRGEVLAPAPVRDALLPDDPHVVADEDRRVFRARVPVFGLLELGEDGRPSVRPGLAISTDRMSATLRSARPGADEAPLSAAELHGAISAAGVTHGVRAAALEAGLRELLAGDRASARLVVAEGTPAVPGRDAGLELPPQKAAGAGADGKVDHFAHDAVVNAEPGELVGVWRPASPGRDGVGVDGLPAPASVGAERTCRPGAGVRVQELGGGRLAVFAERGGVLYRGPAGEVDVVDLLVIDGDLDLARGHVDARASVHVRGTVRSGLQLRVANDLRVDEAVEDALVEVGGDVSVERGVLGGPSGRIVAGGDVRVGYAQNARIQADGDVVLAGSASSTTVECRGKLLATGGQGRLRGGRYCAMRGLEARELGSGFGAPTVVAVGTDPRASRELSELRAELARQLSRLAKIRRAMPGSSVKNLRGPLDAAQARAVRLAMKARRELTASTQLLQQRVAEVERHLFAAEPPTVTVQEHVHGGVEVRILAAVRVVDSTKGPVRFHLDEDGSVAAR